MSFLWGGSKTSDTGDGGGESTVATETLVDQLVHSPSQDDQHHAILQLKERSSSRNSHEAIGRVVPQLVATFTSRNIEVIRAAVEILANIVQISNDPAAQSTKYVELVNTDAIVSNKATVCSLLELLDDQDFYLRYHAIQLLRAFLKNGKTPQVHEAVLGAPAGVNRLMDLLGDHREVVRNEALLLMNELTTSNQEIQKIVAFSDAFERLFDIIAEDGNNNGSIVVIDCLSFVANLLRRNQSNQNYFRETNCIARLPPLLELDDSDFFIMTDDKEQIILASTRIISLLVEGNNPNTQNNQAVLAHHNVLGLMIRLALERVNSAAIRSQALQTLGHLVRNHAANRVTFATTRIKSLATNDERTGLPSAARLLTVMLQSTDLAERTSALYCFNCYLLHNEDQQMAMASTLTPPPDATDQEATSSIGRRLVKALTGWKDCEDKLRAWYAACLLSYIIKDNTDCKELVLRIPLEMPQAAHEVPPTLLTVVMECLANANRDSSHSTNPSAVSTTVGMLRLLCALLDQCPASVKAFVATPSNLPFLVEVLIRPVGSLHVQGLCAILIGLCLVQAHSLDDEVGNDSNQRTAILNIITHRIGMDQFIEKLDRLRKNAAFSVAEKGEVNIPPVDGEMLDGDELEQRIEMSFYDYDFTAFYKDAYDTVVYEIRSPFHKPRTPARASRRELTPSPRPGTPTELSSSTSNSQPLNGGGGTSPAGSSDAVVASYKELIRAQDEQLNELKARVKQLETDLSQQATTSQQQSERPSVADNLALSSELTASREESARLRADVDALRLAAEESHEGMMAAQMRAEELSSLPHALNELEILIRRKDADIAALREQVDGNPVEELHALRDGVTKNQSTIRSLQSSNAQLKTANGQMNVKLHELTKETDELKQLLALAEERADRASANSTPPAGDTGDSERVSTLTKSLKLQEQKYVSLEAEQEELLVCLAKEEIENNTLRERLRILQEK